MSYTLRIPADLKRLLEAEAKRRDESLAQVIISAGWAYLDSEVPGTPVEQQPTIAEMRGFLDRPSDLKAQLQASIDVITAPTQAAPVVEIERCNKRAWSEVDACMLQCILTIKHRGDCRL